GDAEANGALGAQLLQQLAAVPGVRRRHAAASARRADRPRGSQRGRTREQEAAGDAGAASGTRAVVHYLFSNHGRAATQGPAKYARRFRPFSCDARRPPDAGHRTDQYVTQARASLRYAGCSVSGKFQQPIMQMFCVPFGLDSLTVLVVDVFRPRCRFVTVFSFLLSLLISTVSPWVEPYAQALFRLPDALFFVTLTTAWTPPPGRIPMMRMILPFLVATFAAWAETPDDGAAR